MELWRDIYFILLLYTILTKYQVALSRYITNWTFDVWVKEYHRKFVILHRLEISTSRFYVTKRSGQLANIFGQIKELNWSKKSNKKHLRQSFDEFLWFVDNVQGVPKKTHFLGYLDIIPFWKGFGKRRRCSVNIACHDPP